MEYYQNKYIFWEGEGCYMDQNQNYGVPFGNTPDNWQQPETQDIRDVKNQSMQYMNYHVIGQMSDGSQVEGIIEDVDDEGVTMLVPENIEADERNLVDTVVMEDMADVDSVDFGVVAFHSTSSSFHFSFHSHTTTKIQ